MFKSLLPVIAGAAAMLSAPAAGAQSLPLESADGLSLHNAIVKASTLKGKKGIEMTADPEVVKATAAKRRKLLEEMRARGERPSGPGTFESLAHQSSRHCRRG